MVVGAEYIHYTCRRVVYGGISGVDQLYMMIKQVKHNRSCCQLRSGFNLLGSLGGNWYYTSSPPFSVPYHGAAISHRLGTETDGLSRQGLITLQLHIPQY
jgi:hypothetical protein